MARLEAEAGLLDERGHGRGADDDGLEAVLDRHRRQQGHRVGLAALVPSLATSNVPEIAFRF